eukprot:m.348471 g.348471  ORF g.348471 m.348471 type:complete len:626 (-) comp20674_c0_seq1:101-1978(-)
MPAPWLFGQLSNTEATDHLSQGEGLIDGRFLVRTRGNDYVLSVVYKGRPTHHLVARDDEDKLCVNKKRFGTSASNIEDLIAALSKPAKGWPVMLTTYPRAPAAAATSADEDAAPSEGSDNPAWMHGPLSREETEALVNAVGKDGTYMVRQREGVADNYVLCVVYKGRPTHHLIASNASGVVCVNKKAYGAHKTVRGLIEALQKDGVAGWPVALQYPVNRKDDGGGAAENADTAAPPPPSRATKPKPNVEERAPSPDPVPPPVVEKESPVAATETPAADTPPEPVEDTPSEPTTVPSEPEAAPVTATEPVPAASEPAPTASEPVPTASEPVPAVTEAPAPAAQTSVQAAPVATPSSGAGDAGDALPAGWRRVPSRSVPGEFVYENMHTLERQAWAPTAAATHDLAHLTAAVNANYSEQQVAARRLEEVRAMQNLAIATAQSEQREVEKRKMDFLIQQQRIQLEQQQQEYRRLSSPQAMAPPPTQFPFPPAAQWSPPAGDSSAASVAGESLASRSSMRRRRSSSTGPGAELEQKRRLQQAAALLQAKEQELTGESHRMRRRRSIEQPDSFARRVHEKSNQLHMEYLQAAADEGSAKRASNEANVVDSSGLFVTSGGHVNTNGRFSHA